MRTFVAIELPDDVRGALAREQAALRLAFPVRQERNIRWVRPENIHLTLKFLGEISDNQCTDVVSALASLGPFDPFMVTVKGYGIFPSGRRPQVFWAGIELTPAIANLARRLDAVLAGIGFPPERRPFAPHLTLARFKFPSIQPATDRLLEERSGSVVGAFEVSEFFLFSSRLRPEGAEYRKTARFP